MNVPGMGKGKFFLASLAPTLTGTPFPQVPAMPTFTGPTLKIIAAYVCLVVGAIGLVVPVVPGVLPLLLGLKLLGPNHWLTRKATSLWQRFRAQAS